jgi:hypothetical protein
MFAAIVPSGARLAQGTAGGNPMLSRRHFISRGTATLLLIPIAKVVGLGSSGCSSSGTSSPPAAAGDSGSPAPASGDITVTSTVASDPTGPHTHMITVLATDLSSPPAAGATYTSTTANNHAHTVTVSAAQLGTIEGGGSVTVTSSSTGHTHDFMIMRIG